MQPRTNSGQFDTLRRAGADPQVMKIAYGEKPRRFFRPKKSIDRGIEPITKAGVVMPNQQLSRRVQVVAFETRRFNQWVPTVPPGHPAIAQQRARVTQLAAQLSPVELHQVNRLISFNDGPGRPRKYSDSYNRNLTGGLTAAGALTGASTGMVGGAFGGATGASLAGASQQGMRQAALKYGARGFKYGGVLGAGAGLGLGAGLGVSRHRARLRKEAQFSGTPRLIQFARPTMIQRGVNQMRGMVRRTKSDLLGQTSGRVAGAVNQPGLNSAMGTANRSKRIAEKNVIKARRDVRRGTPSPFARKQDVYEAGYARAAQRSTQARAQQQQGFRRQGMADSRQANTRRNVAIGAGAVGVAGVGGGIYAATRPKREFSRRAPRLIQFNAHSPRFFLASRRGQSVGATPFAMAF
jgi:hypothetical protein